jgi:signal transduction histidine kinase
MIDGSMRWLALASRALPDGATTDAQRLETARSQIDTVRETLERMAGMVTSAMKSRAVPLGSPLLGAGSAITIGEAIDHAVDVVRPQAHEQRIGIDVRIEREAGLCPAGAMYSVILNALRNAVESITRCAETSAPATGHIEINAGIGRNERAQRRLIIQVIDDGEGLPAGGADMAFRHGYTVKPDGTGLGLALSRQLVAEAGGTIDLEPRSTDEHAERPGAVFRLVLPAPEPGTAGRTG